MPLKVSPFPDSPVTQVGLLLSVAVWPLPDESAEVAPEPSSRCQRPDIPLPQEAQVTAPQGVPQPPQLF